MNRWSFPDERIHWQKEVVFLLLIGILFVFLIHKGKLERYVELLGTVNEEKTVTVVVSLEQLPQLLQEEVCWIDQRKYSYRVERVEQDILIEENQFYKQVTLKVAMPSDLLQVNAVFSLLISKEQKAIFDILPSCLKEG